MLKRNFYILLFVITLLSNGLFGQTGNNLNLSEIQNSIVTAGYENVELIIKPDTLFVTYENRKFRHEPNAVIELMSLLSDVEVKSICLLARITDVPVFQVIYTRSKFHSLCNKEISITEFADDISITFETIEIAKKFKTKERHNRAFNKLDIVVHPKLKARFGNYNKPIQLQMSLAPLLNVSLWKGMSFSGQVIIPVYNGFENEPVSVEPGLISVNQFVKLPYNSFASVSAGYFTRNRYGIDAELLKFFWDRKMAIHGTMSYTGHASFEDGAWTYYEKKYVNWFADVVYRNPKYDLVLRMGYGKFIFFDKGWRFDMSRQFGEVNIGFYGMQTGGVMNGGFNFAIPISPKKYSTKRFMRIRPASHFEWEYRAKDFPYEGLYHKTANTLNDFLMYYNPEFIKKEVLKHLSNMESNQFE